MKSEIDLDIEAAIGGVELNDTSEYDDEDMRAAYKAGLVAGIRRFAWWKDGEQFAGTCGITLKEALEEVEL